MNLICLFAFFLLSDVLCLTRERLKETGKTMKKSCMPKNEVTEDQVGDIEKGKFLAEKNVMCYIACVYKMGGTIRNNKLNYEAALKQVDLLFPPEIKEPTKIAMAKCKDISSKYSDICEASYYTAKCIYDADPANFFFP